jgi:hypothetical protein
MASAAVASAHMQHPSIHISNVAAHAAATPERRPTTIVVQFLLTVSELLLRSSRRRGWMPPYLSIACRPCLQMQPPSSHTPSAVAPPPSSPPSSPWSASTDFIVSTVWSPHFASTSARIRARRGIESLINGGCSAASSGSRKWFVCSQQPRWPCSSPRTTCPRSGVSAPYAMDGCANGMHGFYLTVVSGLISMSATVPPPSDSYAPTHRHVKADTPKLFREYNVQSMMVYAVCINRTGG